MLLIVYSKREDKLKIYELTCQKKQGQMSVLEFSTELTIIWKGLDYCKPPTPNSIVRELNRGYNVCFCFVD